MVIYGDLFVIYGDLMVIQWWFNGNFMVIPSENQFWWKIMGKTYVINGTFPRKKNDDRTLFKKTETMTSM